MWSNSAPMRVDACRCVPMRADAVDAVISHTDCPIYFFCFETTNQNIKPFDAHGCPESRAVECPDVENYK